MNGRLHNLVVLAGPPAAYSRLVFHQTVSTERGRAGQVHSLHICSLSTNPSLPTGQ